jgi:hypothetical protein
MTAAIVVVAALLLAPGVGAALAFAPPDAISIEGRIALAFGLGYGLVAGVAVLLALAHLFTKPAFIAVIVLATAGVWALALRRASARAHASALRAQAREAPLSLVTGLALLPVVGVVWSFHQPATNLAHRPAWRYWADGLEIASAGHVPAQTAQWGTEIPTTVSKVVLNAFEGGVSFLLGADPLPALGGIVVVTAVGLVAALLALGRELGLGVLAPLVPALVAFAPQSLPVSHEISNHLTWYSAEGVGRMVAFAALMAGIYAVRARAGPALALVTGLLLAVAGLTHGVPALVAGLMLAFYGLAAVLMGRRGLRPVLVGGAVVVAAAAASYVGVLGLSGGDLGFQRAGGASFAGFPPDVDPTRSFTRGQVVRRAPREGHFLIRPRALVKRYAADVIGRSGSAQRGLVALAALAVLTVVLVLRAPSFLPLATVTWGLAALTLLIALFFSFRYRTQVPGDFGPRRMYGYAVLLPGLLVPAFLAALVKPFARGSRIAVPVLALVAGGLALVAVLDRTPNHRVPERAAAGLAVIDRVEEVVPCDARMLANWRTAGTWEATTGRRAVTEGMAPFLRPRVMEHVLPVLIGANTFFDDPQANRGFLTRERVQYLVVVKPGVWIGTHSGRVPTEKDAEAVASVPGVHAIVRDRRVSIFRVGSTNVAPARTHRCPL